MRKKRCLPGPGCCACCYVLLGDSPREGSGSGSIGFGAVTQSKPSIFSSSYYFFFPAVWRKKPSPRLSSMRLQIPRQALGVIPWLLCSSILVPAQRCTSPGGCGGLLLVLLLGYSPWLVSSPSLCASSSCKVPAAFLGSCRVTCYKKC